MVWTNVNPHMLFLQVVKIEFFSVFLVKPAVHRPPSAQAIIPLKVTFLLKGKKTFPFVKIYCFYYVRKNVLCVEATLLCLVRATIYIYGNREYPVSRNRAFSQTDVVPVPDDVSTILD